MMKIKAEFTLGSNVLEAFEEATKFATKNNVIIQFDFNGVDCNAFPDGDPNIGQAMYCRTIGKSNYAANRYR